MKWISGNRSLKFPPCAFAHIILHLYFTACSDQFIRLSVGLMKRLDTSGTNLNSDRKMCQDYRNCKRQTIYCYRYPEKYFIFFQNYLYLKSNIFVFEIYSVEFDQWIKKRIFYKTVLYDIDLKTNAQLLLSFVMANT